MSSSEDPWKRLVEAAKSTSKIEKQEEHPPRLSVRNLRTTVHQLTLTLTWRKWSLIAAIGAGLIFSIVYFSLKDQDPESPPAIQIEQPTDLDLP